MTSTDMKALERFQKKVPWGHLGTILPKNMEPSQWAKEAGLNWRLDQKYQFYGDSEDGADVTYIPKRYTWVRSSDKAVFALSGPDWRPLQNKDALAWIAEYAEAGGVVVEVAGALRGGRIPFALARIKREFEVTKGDRIKTYLLIISPHIIGQSIKIKTMSMRLACMNGMTVSTSKTEYSQNHLKEFDFEAAKTQVAHAHAEVGKAEKRYRTIKKLKISVDDATRKVLLPIFAPEMVGKTTAKLDPDMLPRKVNAVLESMLRAPGADPGTGWGVLNGITHWADHVAGRSESARLTSAWFGANEKIKLAAEARLMELAT